MAVACICFLIPRCILRLLPLRLLHCFLRRCPRACFWAHTSSISSSNSSNNNSSSSSSGSSGRRRQGFSNRLGMEGAGEGWGMQGKDEVEEEEEEKEEEGCGKGERWIYV